MKTITVTNEKIKNLVGLMVDENDPNLAEAEAGMRKTIWKTFLSPMEASKANGLAFITSYIKCKDAIEATIADPAAFQVELEDADFELLFKAFESFNEWNLQFARVILTASECLKSANGGR